MPQQINIAGPHMGFDPASTLGGERFEAKWLRLIDSPLVQCYWVVRNGLGQLGELTPNHHFRAIKHGRGLRRIVGEVRALRSLGKRYSVDLFRFHSVHYGAPTAAMLRASGSRAPILVQHHHVEEPTKKYRTRALLLTRLGAHFASVSNSANEALVALGVPRAQTSVIRSILPDWNPAHANFALGLAATERDYDLVYVGGLIPRKRPEIILDVAIELQKKTPGKKIEVAIVGRGELLASLQKKAVEANLAVDFFDNCDDRQKWDILRRSRIFFFPSAQEGFGYSPLEAALAGLWVVSSDAGSLPEVLGGLENATCVRPDAFHPAYLATVCRERLKNMPTAVPAEQIAHWTDADRWRSEHEKLLFQLAAVPVSKKHS